ncbi:MAG TPA: tetratricopeptide repeat protein [Blastocatellia bacterium]|nr:tetratricopeptide repeat protein [Blastocatellia bacterium]
MLSSTAPASTAAPVIPPATALAANADASEAAIRWLEDRVRKDPDDFIAHNKLADYYLQRLRETGNVRWLELAARTARASLKAIPAEQNPGGLVLLGQTEFASHNFAASRDVANQLISSGLPEKGDRSYPWQLLGDSLLELGDYEGAEKAYDRVRKFGAGGAGVETRLAHYETLRGNIEKAERHYAEALSAALNQVPPSRETVAWIRWQLGELAFAAGDYEAAEKNYRDSLTTFPDYFRALAGLGKARAARGDMAGGIEQYEHAVRIIPEPLFVAALGDLYKLTGREKDAAAQYALVEQAGRLGAGSGALYNRQLALFYADHDLKAEEAYALAAKEYEARRDVYGADALAWAALKAGKVGEAQTAIKEALKLGTKDARMFYHAGMIARAAGDKAAAREHLQRALKLNPQFDPLQSAMARKALEG